MVVLPDNKLLDIIDFLKEHDTLITTRTLFSLADDLNIPHVEIAELVAESAW